MSLLEPVCPVTEMIGLLLAGVKDDGSGAVDEERAQVAVTPLGDTAEPAFEAAGVLARGQAQPACELTGRRESADVPDEGEQGGGGQ